MKKWIAENKKECCVLISILLLATFFRLWRIDEYLPFLGDEGRDVRIVKRFLLDFDLMFIGPRTSIGDMYLGPLYYYLIAPFLAIWRLSPVGPAVFVAVLGVATVWLVWFVGREWFGRVAGLSASFLFAISPVVITHAKHSWNPNIMQFFALLTMYSLWRVWRHKDWKWLLVLGVSFAAVLQSHYLGLLLLPTVALFWFLTWFRRENKQSLPLRGKQSLSLRDEKFLKHSLVGLILFAVLMSPLAIFDAKHGWHNLGAMTKFFTERQTTVSAQPWSALPKIWPLWQENIVERLVVAKNSNLSMPAALVFILGVSWIFSTLSKSKNSVRFQNLLFILAWLGVGLVGLGLYKQHIYDHYFGFLFAAPFLLLGGIFQEIWDKKLGFLVILLVTVLFGINLQENPLKYPPNRQMYAVSEVDKKIIDESEGNSFNFALISKNNYEEGYLYFLELMKAPVLAIDPQRYKETLADQLFVVCEDATCEPTTNAKAEVANFGWSKVEDKWELAGVRLYKLVHSQP